MTPCSYPVTRTGQLARSSQLTGITGMGLTPLEGLIGGTRSGTIDPTAVFHAVKNAGSDAGLEGMKVSKAEATLNKCVSQRPSFTHT